MHGLPEFLFGMFGLTILAAFVAQLCVRRRRLVTLLAVAAVPAGLFTLANVPALTDTMFLQVCAFGFGFALVGSAVGTGLALAVLALVRALSRSGSQKT